jgi:Transposase DNA-binding/Transposase DDE domain
MVKGPKVRTEAPVVGEFVGADLGDARLGSRLGAIVTRLAAAPDVGFPQALASGADLEGFYRFIRNEAVTPEALLKPHVDATVSRLSKHAEVLAVHDTSEFRFGGSREDLGRLTKSGHGFLGHFTLAVSADDRRDPLGTLALHTWTRQKVTPTALRKQGKISVTEAMSLPNEQDRWWQSVEGAESAAGGVASLIHVMDSEADDYDLMSKLVKSRRRWVIRLCYDRRLADAAPGTKTKEFVSERDVLCTRRVDVSRRERQPGGGQRKRATAREQRSATLGISAGPVKFRRSKYCADPPAILDVNIVSVRELNPPSEAEPVEWLLITTEPIESEEQVLKVIDFYRGRWRIEELFKALKTGCAFEKRQLESRQTLLNALALFVPIAWSLLRLRTAARRDDVSATAVLTTEQIEVLRRAAEVPLPARPCAREVMLALARLGGHLRSNGDPGWQVLGRGYEQLLMLVAGYRLANVRCDPS